MRFSELSRASQGMISLCREINFGLVIDIDVVNGEPRATSSTRKRTYIRLDRPAEATAKAEEYDFTLCAQQEQFIRRIQALGNGRIASLEVRDGRPANISIEEVVPML